MTQKLHVAYLEILGDIKNASDVERVLLIEVPERVRQVRRTNLPDAHEDKLVIGVAGEEHRQETLRILQTNIVPRKTLRFSLIEIKDSGTEHLP